MTPAALASIPRGRLRGRVAVVTGGARGVGAEIARLFQAEGARVEVTYLSGAADAARMRRAGIDAVRADVSSESSVRELFRAVKKRFGRLDILVNGASASVPDSFGKDVTALGSADFDQVYAVDVRGTFLCCREAMPLLKKSRGSIVNFSSSAALLGDGTTLLYGAAKAAIDGFTRALARNAAPRVRVNAIAPGSVQGGSWMRLWNLKPKDLKQFAQEVPLKRMGQPSEIAQAALFLASDDSSFVTGQTLIVDGGMYSK